MPFGFDQYPYQVDPSKLDERFGYYRLGPYGLPQAQLPNPNVPPPLYPTPPTQGAPGAPSPLPPLAPQTPQNNDSYTGNNRGYGDNAQDRDPVERGFRQLEAGYVDPRYSGGFFNALGTAARNLASAPTSPLGVASMVGKGIANLASGGATGPVFQDFQGFSAVGQLSPQENALAASLFKQGKNGQQVNDAIQGERQQRRTAQNYTAAGNSAYGQGLLGAVSGPQAPGFSKGGKGNDRDPQRDVKRSDGSLKGTSYK